MNAPGMRARNKADARRMLENRIAYERKNPDFQDEKYLNSYAKRFGIFRDDMVAQ
jgi:hypothetical protein